MTATEELPAVAEPGLAMGRYRLGARLGAGGFGTVYAARDERLGRPVAVKVVPADGADAGARPARGRAVARLDHEGIVALFDAGEEDGCRYLVSELVEGRTLAQLEADGALSDRDVVRIGLALTDALAHAHDRGVIHRDVKPQNVIVPDDAGSRRGAAKLTDFGVAHLAGEDALTLTGDVVGTLAYMAPEQAAGAGAGEHADLYALGVVLYEALAGVHPVRAGSPTATARRIGTRARRRSRATAPTSRAACAPRSTARSCPSPRSAASSRTCSTRSRTRCPPSPTRAGRSRRTRSSGGVPVLPPAIGRHRRARRHGRRWPTPRCAGLTPEPAAAPVARRRRRGGARPPCSRAPGWLARPRSPSPACSRSRPRRGPARRCSCCALALAPAAAPARRRARLGAARRGAAARPRRPRRRLSRRSPAARRAGPPAPRSARSAPGGSCWPSRCSSARSSSARARARPRAPRSTARAGITAGDVIAPAMSSGALLLARDLGRRGAGAAVARPRPLARRRRGRRDRLGGGHARPRPRRSRSASELPAAARPRGRRGGRRASPRWQRRPRGAVHTQRHATSR